MDPGPAEDEGLRLLDNTIATFMRERGIPGASVAISKRGQPVFKKGTHFFSVNEKTPLNFASGK